MDFSLPKSDYLQIERLGHIFDDKSECYKLFWFQVILRKIVEGKASATYEEIVDEMIADAWYMVAEYHLNLGPSDSLERAVIQLGQITKFKPSEDKSKLIEFVKDCKDPIVLKYKNNLINDVPYRLQKPFLDGMKNKDLSGGKERLIDILNGYVHLIYHYDPYKGRQTRIHFDAGWCEYFKRNHEIIRGWLNYKLVEYLQRRNPNVPGVIDKLNPPQERKLQDIQRYWKVVIDVCPLREIYGWNQLEKDNISIDHFVPWSYVANDEIWDLHPTTREINSSKSNNLPKWNPYFKRLAEIEYASYRAMWQYDTVHKEFEKCKREHLNSEVIEGKLYSKGLTLDSFMGALEEVLLPVYQSAKAAGFQEWNYEATA